MDVSKSFGIVNNNVAGVERTVEAVETEIKAFVQDNVADTLAADTALLMTDLLDVRIVTARQAERLLSDRAWRPRTDWMVRSDPQEEGENVEGDDEEEPVPAHLICCWQDDSVDLKDDREYLNYIVELLKARKRLTRA